MRIILASVLTTGVLFGFIACGSDPVKKTTTPTNVTYAEVQATLAGSCGFSTCHGSAKTAVNTLLSASDYIAHASDIQDRISASPTGGNQMPEAPTEWGGASASDITKAKAYLNSL